MDNQITPLTDLRWYSVDFDGVIAESVWPDRGIGPAIEENIQKLTEIHKAGFKIVVHTARPWSDYPVIEDWLVKRGIPFRAIVCGKLLAHRYVDDRAINSKESSWLI